jgi:hypothetical protein
MGEHNDPKKKWKLKSLSIDFKEYGDYKGKYLGKIKFENEREESFQFAIEPEMAERYLKVLAKDIVRSADELTKELTKNLPKFE